MFKKIISFFLVLFLTQSVLAGIDLHHAPNKNSIGHVTTDILVHYVDTHGLDYSVKHQCDSGSGYFHTAEGSLHTTDGSNTSSPALDGPNTHHHDCHGHTTSFSFSPFSLIEANYASFLTDFTYIFSDYSVTLNSPQKPPIFS